jgi:hypothetical protein
MNPPNELNFRAKLHLIPAGCGKEVIWAIFHAVFSSWNQKRPQKPLLSTGLTSKGADFRTFGAKPTTAGT